MKVDAQFVKEVLAACEAALVRRGFSRLRRDGVVLPVSEDFLGWTGLNLGKHDGFIRVNPFVGIHCVSIMKLVADLSSEKYQKGRFATFAIHIGEVCPDIDVFDFGDKSHIGFESERLADIYHECGVPYMFDHASYEALLPMLKSRVPMFGGFPQRYAAALYLSGNADEARQFVIDRTEEYSREDSVIRDNFQRFAEPFLKLMSH